MAGMSASQATERLMDPRLLAELGAAIPGFNRGDLLIAMVASWGGMEVLARDIHSEFQRAQPGSPTRQKILDLVCRLIGQHEDRQAVRPVETLGDDELRAALLSVVPVLTRELPDGEAVAAVPAQTQTGGPEVGRGA